MTIEVSYEKNLRSFLIKLDFSDNHLLKPIRPKWDNRRRAWKLPVCRKSVSFLREIGADFSEEAENIAEETLRPPSAREPFPRDVPLRFKPFDHQWRALDFIWDSEKAALFMEMGTGKSKIAIDWMIANFLKRGIRNAVVFCPIGIVNTTWVKELMSMITVEKFTIRVAGQGFTAYPLTDGLKILVCGYESVSTNGKARKVVDEFVKNAGGSLMCVADESHFIKNPKAERGKFATKIAKKSARKVIMTGTPTTIGPLDLYAQYNFLGGVWSQSNYYSFKARYAEMGGFQGRQIVGYIDLEEIADLTAPFTFSVKSDEVLDLPPTVYQLWKVKPTAAQKRVMNHIKMEKILPALRGEDADKVLTNVLTAYLYLQEVIGGFVKTEDGEVVAVEGGNPKMKALLEVSESMGDKQIIIWARFKAELNKICEELRAVYGEDSVVEYHGDIDEEGRKEAVELFNSGKAKFFVSNQQTGGTGLTLNAASGVIYYSQSFALNDRLQSEKRCHRIGQTKNVVYVDLTMESTIDELIASSIEQKMDLADLIKGMIKSNSEALLK
jgi:hypothetical protein